MFNYKKELSFTCLIFFFIFFFIQLPTSIQNLDSAELVANSYNLTLSHPSGYPTYHWIYYIFLNIFNFKNTFYTASFLGLLFSLGTLFVFLKITFLYIKNDFVRLAFVFHLALSPIYWKYTLIPDVFILHAFLVMGALYSYLKKNLYLLVFFIGLSFANHQTSIFLLPVLIHGVLRTKNLRDKVLASSLVIFFPALIYSSQFFFDDSNFYAWTSLDNLNDLIRHILRMDFGTFSLSGKSREASFLSNTYFFLKYALSEIPLFLIAVVLTPLLILGRKQKKTIELVNIFICFVLFCLVFLTNSNGVEGSEIFTRYLIFIWILFSVLGTVFYKLIVTDKNYKFINVSIITFIIFFSSYNVFYGFSKHNLSKMNVYEDYLRNMVKMIDSLKPNIVIADSDTKVFGLRYLQSVEGVLPNSFIFSKGNIFNSNKMKIVKNKVSGFKFDFKESYNDRNILKRIVIPNLKVVDTYMFLSNARLNVSSSYSLKKLLLGYKISEGEGLSFVEDNPKVLQRTYEVDGLKVTGSYQEFVHLHSEYTYYYLQKARVARQSNSVIDYSKKAILIFPYCFPAYENLCLLMKPDFQKNCLDKLNFSKKSVFNYY